MSNAGVRRIKRAIYIDQSTVHFMTNEEQQKLKDFLLLDQYLNIKESEIQNLTSSLAIRLFIISVA